MLPETGSEDLVAIRHNVGWKTVKTMHILEKESSDVGSIGCGLGRREMCHFGETIDGDKNGVVAGWRRWQGDDEVHGDGRPGTRRNRKRNEETMRLVSRHFGAGAHIT